MKRTSRFSPCLYHRILKDPNFLTHEKHFYWAIKIFSLLLITFSQHFYGPCNLTRRPLISWHKRLPLQAMKISLIVITIFIEETFSRMWFSKRTSIVHALKKLHFVINYLPSDLG